MDDDTGMGRLGLAPWLSGRYRILSLCIASYFAIRFAQVVIGPVVPLVMQTFTVSRGAVGIALTGMWIAYAFTQLPSGVFADKFGEKFVVLVALAITGTATVALAIAPTFVVFAGGVVVVGVGAGMYYNPATSLLSAKFDQIGTVIGTHRVGGQLAGVAAPVVTAIVTIRFGWRTVLGVGAVVVGILGMSFYLTRIVTPVRRPEATLRELFDPRTLLEMLAHRHIRETTVMMTLVEFVGLAAMAFLPTLLVEHFGFSIGGASLLFAVFFGVSALSQPLGGWASDVFGRDAMIGFLMLTGAIGYGMLAIGGITHLALPAVVLTGASMSTTAVIQSRLMDGLTEKNRGTGFGLFRAMYLFLAATGTAVVGILADIAGWETAFGLLSGLLLVVLLVVISIQLTQGRTDSMQPY